MQKVSLILVLFLIITGASANRPQPPKETLKWLTLAEAEITVTVDLRRTVAVSAVRAWAKTGAAGQYSGATLRLAALATDLICQGAQTIEPPGSQHQAIALLAKTPRHRGPNSR